MIDVLNFLSSLFGMELESLNRQYSSFEVRPFLVSFQCVKCE